MRICIVTSYDLSRDGGVNRHVLGLASALTAGGDHVDVLGPASGVVPVGCHGLSGVVGVPANGSMAHIGLLVRSRDTLRFLSAGAFDVVHVHEPIVPGPARQAVSRGAIPAVATFHSFARDEHPLMQRARSAVAWPLRRLRQGIAVSQAAARFARVIYQGPVAVIANGIVGSDFPSQNDAPSPSAAPLSVLFAGRFGERRKGLRHLLQAAALLQQRGLPHEIIVVGDGPRDQFAAMAQHANVRFVGRASDAALAAYYRDADVFCAPSVDGESFGLVLIEAMAAGCPVVASDIEGYAEAAAGSAVLVPPSNPQALADALWRVGQDHALRTQLRSAGKRRAAQLDWRVLAPRVRHIYEQALGQQGCALAGVGT